MLNLDHCCSGVTAVLRLVLQSIQSFILQISTVQVSPRLRTAEVGETAPSSARCFLRFFKLVM